jgi:PAS domain S-box-containing protein
MSFIEDDPANLEKQTARLAEHYRRLVESIQEGVAVVSLDGVITSLSPAFETLTGWPLSQLTGSHFRSYIHPADLPLAIERHQREKNGERLPPTRLRLLQSSGMYRSVEITSQPELEDGKVSDVWVLVRDLSEEKQLEKQQEEIAQEERRVKSLLDLFRAAAVRVRSPLTILYLEVYRLSKQVPDPTTLSSLESIQVHVEQVAQLIERVLTMAELDADRAHFSFRPVKLNRLLAHIQVSMSPLAEAKKIAFTVSPDDDLPPVKADEVQLYRAIQEITENALEYTPENGAVTVKAFQRESQAIIEVQDTGIGIAPDSMPHLFEQFYHFDLPTSGPGKLGLGLPIAKKIIDKHGGVIDVVSAPGNGSTFTIAIPLL